MHSTPVSLTSEGTIEHDFHLTAFSCLDSRCWSAVAVAAMALNTLPVLRVKSHVACLKLDYQTLLRCCKAVEADLVMRPGQ